MTDAFTTAAESASWERDRHSDDTGDWSRLFFMRGALWARDHLAAQEPTDAEVEAVAVLLYRQRAPHHTMESWGREPEPVKNRHRLDARAALTTAKEARHG